MTNMHIHWWGFFP